MLPKALRMTTREFKGLKARPVYRGAFFDISVSPAPSTKYACIISKKRIKRAVDRNRAKRKIYALLPHNTPSPLFVLIYPTKNAINANHTALKEEVAKAFATL